MVNRVHSQATIRARTLELLWASRAPRSRGPQPRVTLDDIAAAGVRWADAQGLSGLTLAGVAGDLGLTTTALYRYIDSKDALLELMVNHAIGYPPKLTGKTWRDRTQVWTKRLCERYRRHHWVTQVQIAGPPSYPASLAWLESLLNELDDSPIGDPMRLALVLDGLARALALVHADPDSAAPPDWLVDAITQRYPRVASELQRDWGNVDDELPYAVNTVLAGAEQLRRK